MMDELELLKKDWEKKEESLPKLSFDQIHKMLWKKSSSIVRWILIISILELALPHLLYLLPSTKKNFEVYHNLGLNNILVALSIIQYLVVFYFIYQFYTRYKEISVLDDAKSLMSKIIKTRRTVKHYVIFCLVSLFITCVILVIGIYLTDNISDIFPIPESKNVSPEKFKRILLWSMSIFSIVIVFVMGGIYFLLYGLLLRKLKRNYKELKQLEV
ncbi:magnesium-transporting ATPase (P-type) [Saonia flava]|uniref:Magnesium-transporting ATPase (P-type) n=1 Tax=Saonia flava TaxID=523696 RepID=A0A846QV89_9FLAO|nr:hypothetical protein [Saonia flava]NJB70482.1 magnesium-transporting ATPase (P-type) [Saonia flava]